MKLPDDVRKRQDDLRKAAAIRREAEPQIGATRTMGDDCAAVLDAWYSIYRNRKGGYVLLTEEDKDELCRRMRALGMMVTLV